MIIGVVGPICAGKDELADVLVNEHGFHRFSLADELREILNERRIEVTRVNMQDIGDELRETEGLDFLAKRILQKLNSGDSVIIGFRNPGEMRALLDLPGFRILMVDAPLEMRFNRALARQRESEARTLEEFKVTESRDLGVNQPSHGQQNAALFEMARHKILNEGNLEDLKGKVSDLLKEIR